MNTNVPIGPSSVLGWLAAAAGLLTTVVQSIENNGALVSGPGKWPAILGVVVLAATNLGRQFQAARLPVEAKAAESIARLAASLEALAKESLAKVQAEPDHVDSASVAVAQPSKEA